MGAEAGKTPKGGHGAPQSQDKQPQCQPGHGNDTRACTLCETTNFLSRSGTRMTWFTSTAIRSMRLFMQRNERLNAATCRQCPTRVIGQVRTGTHLRVKQAVRIFYILGYV